MRSEKQVIQKLKKHESKRLSVEMVSEFVREKILTQLVIAIPVCGLSTGRHDHLPPWIWRGEVRQAPTADDGRISEEPLVPWQS